MGGRTPGKLLPFGSTHFVFGRWWVFVIACIVYTVIRAQLAALDSKQLFDAVVVKRVSGVQRLANYPVLQQG